MMDESDLLEAVVLGLRIRDKRINPRKDLMAITGSAEATIYNWLKGQGSMGIENWMKVQTVTGFGFIQEWIDRKVQQHRKGGE